MWPVRLEGTNAQGATLDALGNVYAAGYRHVHATGTDAVVWKLDKWGNLRWESEIVSPGTDSSSDIIADDDGNTFITGHTTDVLSSPSAGSWDAFVVSLDSDGTRRWTTQFGTALADVGESIALSPEKEPYVAWHGSRSGFVSALNRDGVSLSSTPIDSDGNDLANTLAVDASGYVYVAGGTTGDLGAPPQGDRDAFVRKMDPAGSIAWTLQFGTEEYDQALDISLDPEGNVYVLGRTLGVLGTIDPTTGAIVLAKLDSTGNLLWIRQWGEPSDYALCAEWSNDGTVLVGGYSGPSTDRDAFVSKLDANGEFIWTTRFGTSEGDRVNAMGVDANGDIFLAGGLPAFVAKMTADGELVGSF